MPDSVPRYGFECICASGGCFTLVRGLGSGGLCARHRAEATRVQSVPARGAAVTSTAAGLPFGRELVAAYRMVT